jgi:aspartyl-tRNA(Asn)/glutamyl-tRNA(Gln) amidotransferase subunit B
MKYEIVIGLEIHAQMSTASKAFCGDSATYGGAPNSHISPISLAHPGTLPKANIQHLENAVKLGLATNCTINQVNYFDRKNYFYPDLPKGFQTTQDNLPVCVEGWMDIQLDENTTSRIRLNRIHAEEDAGKSIHDLSDIDSMIDLNRAGVPLLEIVSEPDLRSPEEAGAFVANVRRLVRYLEICDGNMEEGSLRCDCNVSIRLKGATEYGTRCEVKNVNSISNVRACIAAEAKRQIELIEKGEAVIQQTRTFDVAKGITLPLRNKEDAHDYRYFPEPDLPPVLISDEKLAQLKSEMPALPDVLYQQFMTDFKLSSYDATILVEEKAIANYFLELTQHTKNYKSAANWLINSIRSYLNENGLSIQDFSVTPQIMAQLIQLIDEDKVGNLVAKQNIFPLLVENPNRSPLEIAESLNLIQEGDADFITTLVQKILAEHPKEVEEYKNLSNNNKGKKRKKGLTSLFVGQIMKQSKGKANPKIATATLMKVLNS